MYHGSICQVLAITTQASAVPVCPSQGIPASSTPSFMSRPFKTPYWPLKIQLQRNPMAVPGIIQFTSVTPRRNSEPLKPWFNRMAQMNPRVNGSSVEKITNTTVVHTVFIKYGSANTFR